MEGIVRANEAELLRFPFWEDKRENPADPSNFHFNVIFQEVGGANCGTRTRANPQ